VTKPPSAAVVDRGVIGYREITPSSFLAGLVECYWSVSGRVAGGRGAWNRVLPDGCMDVILNLGDPVDDGAGPSALRSYVVGVMRVAMRVRHTGRADVVGIRFRPGGATAFLGVPASELTDATAPLESVVPGAGELESRTHDAGDAVPGGGGALLHARRAVLESWLGERYRPGAPDRAVLAVASGLERSRGRARLAGLREPLGISERTLERRFAVQVGSSPAELRTAIRVREAAARLSREPGASLACVAVACGYHDQAHLTREFRRLAGITPAAYARERNVGFVQSEDAGVA
jgi:AraC-like DNA-binding protein